MLNQGEEKTGAWLSGHGACDIGKWSDFFPVCGIIVVKRKITANLAVIFLELVDSKGIEPSTSAMRTQRSPS